jgi:hypothetical protein
MLNCEEGKQNHAGQVKNLEPFTNVSITQKYTDYSYKNR